MDYKKALLLLICLSILYTFSTIAADTTKGYTEAGTFPIDDSTKTLDMLNTPSAEGNSPNPVEIKHQNGKTGDATGNIKTSGNTLTTDLYKGDDGGPEYKTVEDFYYGEGDEFYAKRADYFAYNGLTATNVENIYGSPSEITLGRAEHIEYKGVELEDANILFAGKDVISVANADLVERHDVIAENVLTTTIRFDNEILRKIDLMSKKDNNTFEFEFVTTLYK